MAQRTCGRLKVVHQQRVQRLHKRPAKTRRKGSVETIQHSAFATERSALPRTKARKELAYLDEVNRRRAASMRHSLLPRSIWASKIKPTQFTSKACAISATGKKVGQAQNAGCVQSRCCP